MGEQLNNEAPDNITSYEYTDSILGPIALARLHGEKLEDMELPQGYIVGEDGELHRSNLAS